VAKGIQVSVQKNSSPLGCIFSIEDSSRRFCSDWLSQLFGGLGGLGGLGGRGGFGGLGGLLGRLIGFAAILSCECTVFCTVGASSKAKLSTFKLRDMHLA